jgi:hypothetical protein
MMNGGIKRKLFLLHPFIIHHSLLRCERLDHLSMLRREF